jgi:ArsR family transcriptional regulator
MSTDAEKPTKLDYDVVEAADVVITMGCGETCPIFPGKRWKNCVVGRWPRPAWLPSPG